MTAQGHLLFSVTCALLAHKVELTPALAGAAASGTYSAHGPGQRPAAGSRSPPVPCSVGSCPGSPGPRSPACSGHRGFTHSLLGGGPGDMGAGAGVRHPGLLSGAVKGRPHLSAATSATCSGTGSRRRAFPALALAPALRLLGLPPQERRGLREGLLPADPGASPGTGSRGSAGLGAF